MSKDVRDRKFVNGDRINGLFHLLINGVYWGYNPLILTFDPNFQRDIQVGITGFDPSKSSDGGRPRLEDHPIF